MLELMHPLYERIASVFEHIGNLCLLLPYSRHKSHYTYDARCSIARFSAAVQADMEKLKIAGNALVAAEKMVAEFDVTTKANKIRSLEMLEITGERIKRDFVKDSEHE